MEEIRPALLESFREKKADSGLRGGMVGDPEAHDRRPMRPAPRDRCPGEADQGFPLSQTRGSEINVW